MSGTSCSVVKRQGCKYGSLLALIIAITVQGCGYDRKLVETLDPPGAGNNPVATINATGKTSVKTNVTLDGSASNDPNNESLAFAWTLAERPYGSSAVLSSDTSAVTTFFADKGGYYSVTLLVTNATGLASETATARINVTGSGDNHPPVAQIKTTISGGAAILDGSDSYDIDGGAIAYRWDVISSSGGVGELSADNTSVTTLRVSSSSGATANFIVKLQVSDGLDTDEAYSAVALTP